MWDCTIHYRQLAGRLRSGVNSLPLQCGSAFILSPSHAAQPSHTARLAAWSRPVARVRTLRAPLRSAPPRYLAPKPPLVRRHRCIPHRLLAAVLGLEGALRVEVELALLLEALLLHVANDAFVHGLGEGQGGCQ